MNSDQIIARFNDNKLVRSWAFSWERDVAYALCGGPDLPTRDGSLAPFELAKIASEGAQRSYVTLPLDDALSLHWSDDKLLLVCCDGSVYEINPADLSSTLMGKLDLGEDKLQHVPRILKLPDSVDGSCLKGKGLLLYEMPVQDGFAPGIYAHQQVLRTAVEMPSLEGISLNETILDNAQLEYRFLELTEQGHVAFWENDYPKIKIYREGTRLKPSEVCFGNVTAPFKYHEVHACAIAVDTRYIAFVVKVSDTATVFSGSGKPKLVIADARSVWLKSLEFDGDPKGVGNRLEFSRAGSRLYAQLANTLRVFEIGHEKVTPTLLQHGIQSFGVSRDNLKLYLSHRSGHVSILKTGGPKVDDGKEPKVKIGWDL